MVIALGCVGQGFMLHSTVHKWGSRQRKSQMWLSLQNPNTEEKRLGARRSDKFKVDGTKNNIWSFICYVKHHKPWNGLAFGKF